MVLEELALIHPRFSVRASHPDLPTVTTMWLVLKMRPRSRAGLQTPILILTVMACMVPVTAVTGVTVPRIT